MLRESFNLMFTRQNSYTLGRSYILLKHVCSLGYLYRHNSEDTSAKSFWIVVLIVQWFFYGWLKPVSLTLLVTKMYQMKPYLCLNYFLGGGMTQTPFSHRFGF